MIVNTKIANMFKYCGFVNIDYLIENKLETNASKILNILNRDWRKWVKPLCMFDGGDPTFGYTTAGASTSYVSTNQMYGSLFTAPTDVGTANSITIYGQGSPGNGKGVIVLHNNLTIISNGITAAFPIDSFLTWCSGSFSPSPPLTPSTDYVLMIVVSDSLKILFKYDAGNIAQGHCDLSNSYASPIDPTDATHLNNKYSIYCTYTSAVVKKAKPSGIAPLMRGMDLLQTSKRFPKFRPRLVV